MSGLVCALFLSFFFSLQIDQLFLVGCDEEWSSSKVGDLAAEKNGTPLDIPWHASLGFLIVSEAACDDRGAHRVFF